jgi:nitrite reductase/ring-hydroxylating ferredoxin subunit
MLNGADFVAIVSSSYHENYSVIGIEDCRRILRADLANGKIDEDGCLVCPWHQSRYDPTTGRMVVGPQAGFEKVPGLDTAFIQLTMLCPLRRAEVVERGGKVHVRNWIRTEGSTRRAMARSLRLPRSRGRPAPARNRVLRAPLQYCP